MNHTQILSYEEIERAFEACKGAPGKLLRGAIGRAIETAILAKLATSAQEGQAAKPADERIREAFYEGVRFGQRGELSAHDAWSVSKSLHAAIDAEQEGQAAGAVEIAECKECQGVGAIDIGLIYSIKCRRCGGSGKLKIATPQPVALGELPPPSAVHHFAFDAAPTLYFTTDQMRAYGEACARASASAAGGEVAKGIDWKAATKAVDEYADSYEFRGDGGDYSPNERESMLIADAMHGLLSDDDFLAALNVTPSPTTAAGEGEATEPDFIEPLSEFREGQWWVKELDDYAKTEHATPDQKRAVAVVHHLLRAVRKFEAAPSPSAQAVYVVPAAAFGVREGNPDNTAALQDAFDSMAAVTRPSAQAVEDLIDEVDGLLRSLSNYPAQLVPINRNSAMVRAIQKAVDAARSPSAQAVPEGWRGTLENIDLKAEAGLCQMTAGGKHGFLKDIRALVAAAATQPPQDTSAEGAWMHLKPYGYAPGGYMSRCSRCDVVQTGLDKRATCCKPCAEAAYASQDTSGDGGERL